MTDNAMPRYHADRLVPACAVGVPKAITGASEELRLAAVAADHAFDKRRQAEAAARGAGAADSEAAIAAIRAGKEPPAPTSAAKEAEVAAALRRERATNEVAKRASFQMERLIRRDRDPWIAAQRGDAERRTAEALELLDQFELAAEALAASAYLVGVLQRDESGTIDHGRSLALAGSARRSKHSAVGRSLADLRAAVAGTVPAPLSGPPTPEEAKLAQEQRAMQQLARGGLALPRALQ